MAAIPNPNRRVLRVEERFEFTWEAAGIALTGYIDLVERDEAAGLVLTDFKSNVDFYLKISQALDRTFLTTPISSAGAPVRISPAACRVLVDCNI